MRYSAPIMQRKTQRRVLAIDVGGTHVKLRVSGQRETREFESGPTMTPRKMVVRVRQLTRDLKYDVISMGYPGVVVHGKVVAEPHNLGKGWVGFDFRKAFGRPIQLMNDAAMQAIGSYEGGRMLFLGLGTVLAQRSLSMAPWRRWNLRICLTRTDAPSRTTSATAAAAASVPKNGAARLQTWSSN